MKQKNRRKHFLVDKPLQFHYLAYVVATLLIVSSVGITGTYFGVWASVLKVFSEESLQETMTTAAQIYEYDQARRPTRTVSAEPTLRNFRETALLSDRQKELIQQILDDTDRRLIGLGLVLIVFIGWGSIFITHKIAGPLFRFNQSFQIVKSGDLRLRINLRKFDEAKRIAQNFNEMLAVMDQRIHKMKVLARQGPRETALEELKNELSNFKTTFD